ncbi:hypothetical protein VW29_03275 [Devosia limi DSM 17137]|nr:hypothetical protein VW29_03170 [Devosia limi DSM 17137]KKB86311.1 hypothetical protein VW29_03275 [Devosia limi DSM 17137]
MMGQQVVRTVLVIAATVFLASLFGILTRPVGYLAAIWPANAILLGLMVRRPEFASAWGWGAAFAGYIAADLVTGGRLGITLWLTAANLAGVLAGYLCFRRLAADHRALRRPISVLYLFAVCVASAVAAALVGGWMSKQLFAADFIHGLELWFTSELVNTLVVLPMILTFPPRDAWRWPRLGFGRADLEHAAPALALLLSCMASGLIGGPGALAYPVPALLWCALTYGRFTTAAATAAVSAFLLVLVTGAVGPQVEAFAAINSTSSTRLGIALMALGPLTVASVNSARNEVLASLSLAVNHDGMTGVLSRRAFMRISRAILAKAARHRRSVTLLMFDIDNFKQINDGHGHQVGDEVLIMVAKVLDRELGAHGRLARIGGEEFAVVVADLSAESALALAERLRAAVEAAPQGEGAVVPFPISTCVGVSHMLVAPDGDPDHGLSLMLGLADGALYRAKSAGRNSVVSAAQAAIA